MDIHGAIKIKNSKHFPPFILIISYFQVPARIKETACNEKKQYFAQSLLSGIHLLRAKRYYELINFLAEKGQWMLLKFCLF